MSALILGALTLAQDPALATNLPPLRPDTAPFFNSDVAVSLDSTGHTGLSVSITIAHAQLQWVRVPAGFAAAAEFVVVFDPVGAGRMYGDVWERRIVVDSFAATNAVVRVVNERRRFAVAPGKYRIRVGVRDVNAELESQARQVIDVKDYSREPLGFADLELGVLDSAGVFVPNPTRLFGTDVARLATRAVLFDRRAGAWPRTYPFRYRITDESGAAVVAGVREVTVSRSAEPVIIRPERSDLFIGTYAFDIELVDGRSRWVVERSFEVEESGPPSGREFERMLEPLSYIAEPREMEHLRSLPADRQAEGWAEFWRRRDPTPETPRNEVQLEFFRRVRYAEKHFQGFGPGWRSDMGRIYIKFGPADQIESRPASLQTGQLEIWYYNQPYRRFVFEDREGFGRFVLRSPVLE